MVIGIPKERKSREYRVAVTPDGATELVRGGRRVLVEASAGRGSGFADEDYRNAGAHVADRDTVFADADLIVKVKEPLPEEYGLLREGQTLFTFLHLAPNPGLTAVLLERKVGVADVADQLGARFREAFDQLGAAHLAAWLQRLWGLGLLTAIEHGLPEKVRPVACLGLPLRARFGF